WLVEDYPIPQILLVRFLVFLVFALALARRRGLRTTIRSRKPALQVVRTLVMLAEIWVFVWAFSLLPLANVHAIAAVSPLIAMALAVPLLGERVGWHRWAAVGAGLVGVFVIVRPGVGATEWAMAIPLLAAFLWALLQVLIRKVGLSDPIETTGLWTAAIAVLAMALIAPFVWIAPTSQAWGLLLLTGLLGTMGHMTLFKALELAPASAVQPSSYMMMVWAAVLGFLVFGAFPDGWTIAGACIIAASGLYAFARERRRPAKAL
ncbi:MAG: DMT family transporter, partial [Proteobacteria bacterium]|nr:DMT family transporter [Pseudomonadota bacterium]